MPMRTVPLATVLITLSALSGAAGQPAGVRPHAGMLRYPAISKTQIAFVYANKLWLAPREGGVAAPAANPPGAIIYPRFSPDGRTLAFTANYDGNLDLYTLPVDGGNPFRVTYHPGDDFLTDWTPDGKLLFSNSGYQGIARTSRLMTVSPQGGAPTALPVPYGEDAAISPDGKLLAYTPSSTNRRTWKRYRGGWAQDIWLLDLQTRKSRRITDWEGTDTFPMWQGDKIYYLSDGGPEHRLNIWQYDTKAGRRQQVTKFADYDVKWPSIGPGASGGGEIVYQHGSGLQALDLSTSKSRTVEIRIPGDRPTLRARSVDAAGYIESWSISPSGKRVAVVGRGDIWTLPAKEGSPRNLTRTSGTRERDAVWSPDGKWIAYLSDQTGEYEVYITRADGKGETRQLTKGNSAYLSLRSWSPDSKWILYADKAGAAFLLNVATQQVKQITKDPLGGGASFQWSPDSRWIAYAETESVRKPSAIWIYSVETAQKRRATAGAFADQTPVFDRKGEYLYYVSSRSFTSPLYDDQGQTWIYPGTQLIIAAPLRADIASPYNAKSDEEPSQSKDDADKKEAPGKKALIGIDRMAPEADQTATAIAADDEVSGTWLGTASPTPLGNVAVKMTLTLNGASVSGAIEVEKLGNGTVTGTFNPATKEILISLMVGNQAAQLAGKIANGAMTLSGKVAGATVGITAMRQGGAPSVAAVSTGAKAPAETKAPVKVIIDFDGLEERSFQLPIRAGRFGTLAVNAQNQLMFIRQPVAGSESGLGLKLFDINDPKSEEKSIAASAGDIDLTPDGSKVLVSNGNSASIHDAVAGSAGESVPTGGMTMEIEPREEWAQIFNEAWRMERDFFYDPNMHGVSWSAVRDQYRRMLEDCNSREDVGYVISEMISELNVGHAYYSGGDVTPQPVVPVGTLGADFELAEGAYRIGKIYRGGAWDTDAKGPLSRPGIKIKEGDYLLAVNGVPVDARKDPYAAFVGLAGKVVTLTVSAKPKLDGDARDVPIRMLNGDGALRYRAWIEKNRAYVDKMTGGKVGYIYVPNTGVDGQNDLVRQFLSQTGKEALIIDERWNGGGQIPDRFIEMLNRPVTNYWARRDGQDWMWPPVANNGPKCMLINGLAGSGGDAFPWYFRQSKLGKLIGTRTWGGLVGLSGNPPLVDGADVTVPTFAFYKPNGTWAVEGHGVDPDIEVIDDPALMQNGADPQLDAAIKQMEDELKRAPFTPAKRPAYPDRRGIGIPPKDR